MRFLLIIAAICVGLWVLAQQMVDAVPLSASTSEPNAQDLLRARRLLAEHFGPRPAVSSKSVTLSERDLNLLAALGLAQAFPGRAIGAEVALEPGYASWLVSIPLPANPLGGWVNLEATIEPGEESLKLVHLRVGQVPVPKIFLPILQDVALDGLALVSGVDPVTLMSTVGDFQFEKNQISARPQWDRIQSIQSRWAGKIDPVRLMAYRTQLVAWMNVQRGASASLVEMLADLGRYANTRIARGEDPNAELRAMLAVSAMQVVGKTGSVMKALNISQYESLPKPRALALKLRAREDLAQHFLVSAALTVALNATFADAIGLTKELEDSKGGSGFSFSDLMADRAGVRLATTFSERPKGWALRLSMVRDESEIMPSIEGLPPELQAEAFRRRFAERDNVAWAMASSEIDRRLNALDIYQP